ncbi:MAG: D-alanine--D-alanine ligase [Actinomycetota bacterium]|nr:D-alanine--D-alanine ligase [Actinomycetota bacterium]
MAAEGSHPPRRVRLVVLFGGVSAEHDVSCITAAHVLRAIDQERYSVLPIGIRRDGQWVRADDAIRLLSEGGTRALPRSLEPVGTSVELMPTLTPADADEEVVVLPLLHGPLGEDGTMQGLLEMADVAYVGAGVLGSAMCMDKAMAKVVLGAAGIPQVNHLAARNDQVDEDFFVRVVDELGLPVFVKPANLGSSVGITRAVDLGTLRAAVTEALAYDEWVVVEEAVTAREIEIGVLGNADPRMSVPGEIVPSHEFYDYADKYLDGAARMVIPADLPTEVADTITQLAGQAYAALRCDGMARVDFFYEDHGRGVLLNEVNTIPGFTPWSMYPSLWEASGVSYRELIDELVRHAIDRHAHRQGHGRPH